MRGTRTVAGIENRRGFRFPLTAGRVRPADDFLDGRLVSRAPGEAYVGCVSPDDARNVDVREGLRECSLCRHVVDRHRQTRSAVRHLNLENISAVEIHSRTGHVHRRGRRRSSIRVDASRVAAFASIVVKIELHRHTGRYSPRASRCSRPISQTATGRTERRGSAAAMNRKHKTVRVRARELERKARRERLDVDRRREKRAASLARSRVGQTQTAAVDRGAAT